jgi:hypothetical protein
MLPTAVIAHSALGRVRFKVAERRRQEEFFAMAAERLGAAPGVRGVEVNPLTGSILVHHEGQLSKLQKYAEANGLFTSASSSESLPILVRRQVSWLDRQVQERSEQFLTLESLALLLLLGMGMLQLLRGQLAAPAVTAFWYAGALLAASRQASERAGPDTP